MSAAKVRLLEKTLALQEQMQQHYALEGDEEEAGRVAARMEHTQKLLDCALLEAASRP